MKWDVYHLRRCSCLATDVEKSRLNWKLKVSNTADSTGITQSKARDTSSSSSSSSSSSFIIEVVIRNFHIHIIMVHCCLYYEHKFNNVIHWKQVICACVVSICICIQHPHNIVTLLSSVVFEGSCLLCCRGLKLSSNAGTKQLVRQWKVNSCVTCRVRQWETLSSRLYCSVSPRIHYNPSSLTPEYSCWLLKLIRYVESTAPINTCCSRRQ